METRVYIFGASSGIAEIISEVDFGDAEIVRVSRTKLVSHKGFIDETVKDYSINTIKQLLSHKDPAKSTTVIFCNGITDKSLFVDSVESIEEIMSVNVISPLQITHCFLDTHLFSEVRFIFLGSSRASLGDPGIVLYSSSKGAICAAVKSLSLEYGKMNKFFFVLSLGLTASGLIGKIKAKKIDELKSRSAIKSFVDETEIKKAICFLHKNRSMTGSVLHCDNGYH